MLKMLIGLLKCDSGQIVLDGVDIAKKEGDELTAVRRRIAYLFQGAALFDSLTVGENVAYGLREQFWKTMTNEEIEARVEQSLGLVGLPGIQVMRPSDLSGGMKKRVGLARAIIRNPEIILYDEPTAGLDPVMGTAINDLILDMQKKLGVTSVLVTHDMSSAFRVSNRIAMLVKGRIVKLGTPAEFRVTDDPLIKQFIYGESEGPLTRATP
jgi:phospholipid/cholesterol/gamma-HCH transport system ATP-binding protein